MTTNIDADTLALLRGLIGKTIVQISALRYPGVAGYTELLIADDEGRSVSLKLRIFDVSDELEVCVPVATLGGQAPGPWSVDRFVLAGFRVARVYKLQRREFIEKFSAVDENYVGSNPREQVVTDLDSSDFVGADVVDAGVAFDSDEGISLECYADAFPLVFQMRLTVASSSLPSPRRLEV